MTLARYRVTQCSVGGPGVAGLSIGMPDFAARQRHGNQIESKLEGLTFTRRKKHGAEFNVEGEKKSTSS